MPATRVVVMVIEALYFLATIYTNSRTQMKEASVRSGPSFLMALTRSENIIDSPEA
jgi:hypothetical protein